MTIANIRIFLKRGNTDVSEDYIGFDGEVTVDSGVNSLRVHDGQTVGGFLLPTRQEIGDLANSYSSIETLVSTANDALNQNTSILSNLQSAYDNLSNVAFTADYSDLTNTPTNVSSFTNDADYASVSYVDNSISDLIDSAPGALNTLNELSSALGNNANFATTITDSLTGKLNTVDFNNTADGWISTKTTSDIEEGSNLYYTTARANTDFDTLLANKNTTYLAEGVNLYYTNTRVQNKLEDVTGNIVPRNDATYNLGSPDKKFKDLYLSGSTIYLGDLQLKEDNGQFKILDNIGQPISTEITNLSIQTIIGQGGLILTTSAINSGEQILISPAALNDAATYVTIDSTDLNISSNAYFTGSINSNKDIITSGNISALTFTGDLTGDVYSDSGTLMISSGNATVTGFVENLSVDTALLNVENITVKTGGGINLNGEDIAQVGNINVVQLNSSEVNSGSVAIGQINIDNTGIDLGASGVLSGLVEGQLTGNVYSETGDLLVNATDGTVVGPVETSYVNAGSIGADIYAAGTPGNFINLGVNASSVNVTTGIDMLTHNITNANSISATTFVGNITGQTSDISNHTTTELTEGTNLYYTSSRVRNELQVNDTGGDGSLSYDTATGIFTFAGPSASETRAHFSVNDAGGDGSLSYDNSTGVFTYTGPDATEVRSHFVGGTGIDIIDGVISISQPVGANDAVQFDSVIADLVGNVTGDLVGNVTGDLVGNVTGQVSDISNHTTDALAEGNVNLYYLDSRARSSISVVNVGGDGEIAYDNNTGVVSYTGPSAANVRAHLSAGTGVTYSSTGEFSIGQDVSTSADVQFHDVTVQGNLFVQGNTTVVDSTNTTVSDNIIVLNNGEPGSAVTAGAAGIEVDRGSAGNVSFLFRESDGNWTTGAQGIVTEDQFYGNIVGSVFSNNAEIMVDAVDYTLHADNVNAIAFNGSLVTNGGPGRGPLQIMAGGVDESGHTIFINPYGTDTVVQTQAENIILYTGPYTPDGFGNTYPSILFQTAGSFKARNGAYFEGDLIGNVTGDIQGNVTGQVSDITNHTTDAISEGTINLYYDDTRVDDRVDVHLSGGVGVTYTSGNISIGQDVSVSASPEFNSVYANNFYGELIGNVTGQVSDITNHTTDAISEGNFNLYYDDTRVDNRVDVHLSGGTGVTYTSGNISIGQDVATTASPEFNSVYANNFYGELIGNVTGQVSDLSNLSTDSLSEGTFNLYYDDTRVDDRVDIHLNGGTGVTYLNGTISIGQDVSTSAIVQFSTVQATTLYGDLVGNVTGQVSDITNHTTDAISEGNFNLYYQDTRVDDRVDIHLSGGTGVTYSNGTISIAQDISTTADVTFGNISTTNLYGNVTGQISSIANHTTDSLTEGNVNLYYTDVRVDERITEINSLLTTNDITEGNVNLYYTDNRVQTKLGNISGNLVPDTDIAYDLGSDTKRWKDLYLSGNTIVLGNVKLSSNNSSFSVTDLSNTPLATSLENNNSDDLQEGTNNLYYTEERAQAAISAGTGVIYSSGEVSIGQDVSTTADVTFANVSATGDVTILGQLIVSGTTTTINTETINLADNIIVLNSNEEGNPSQSAGIAIERGVETNKFLIWDESNKLWTVNNDTFKANLFLGNLQGNVTGDVTGNVTGQISDISNHTTSGLSEGANLYYTDDRARAALSFSQGTGNYDSVSGVITIPATTLDITEDTNLYYTDSRVRAAISGSDTLVYNESTGNFDLASNVVVSTQQGHTGQIPYINEFGSSSVTYDYVIKAGNFVENSVELTDAQNAVVDFSSEFNTWYKFSHNTTMTFPANANDILGWSYNDLNNTITSTTNSVTYMGAVSALAYDQYLHEVRVTSTSTDDDTISVIVAWYKDPATGHEFTLSAVRESNITSGGGGYAWALIYNFRQSDQWIIQDAESYLTTGSSYWNSYVNGTNIKVERNGDLINCYTTDINDANYIYLTDSTLVLNVDLSSDPRLEKFRGPRPYGYGTYSQSNALFEVLRFEDPSQSIYDLSSGSYYLKSEGSWVLQSSNIWDVIGVGKFLVNPTTGKMYFTNSSTTVVRVGNFVNVDDNIVNVPALELDGYATLDLPTVAEGTIVFDSDTKQFKGFNGTSWVVLG